MSLYPELIEKAITELSRLPGVGRRSAERMVFYILGASKEEAKTLASAIYYMRDKVSFCSRCNNFAQGELCPICSQAKRDESVLCIVERPSDVSAIEKAGVYNGLYYVLLGAVVPGGAVDIKTNKLERILSEGKVKEVIVATDADAEGETTAVYVREIISKYPGIKACRIGMGIAVGANIEYCDAPTLAKALESRIEL